MVAWHGPQTAAASVRQLVIGTCDEPGAAASILEDLLIAGFQLSDVAIVAGVHASRGELLSTGAASARCGAARTIACCGLGQLLIIGEGLPEFDAPGDRASVCDLSRALVEAGLTDADALIYELALIRGQCLLIVATPPQRVALAYRLLLRRGGAEVHLHRR